MAIVCVYLGAFHGNSKDFKDAVVALSKEIVSRDFTLIYGGSSLGMMGLLAQTVKSEGGKVIGVITDELLKKEKPIDILDKLHIADSIQERKKIMQDQADMFIVMPGGLGTLEEALETWNLIKIGTINKPIGFLNVNGFFDELFVFMDSCKDKGFLSEIHRIIPEIDYLPSDLLEKLKAIKK